MSRLATVSTEWNMPSSSIPDVPDPSNLAVPDSRLEVEAGGAMMPGGREREGRRGKSAGAGREEEGKEEGRV